MLLFLYRNFRIGSRHAYPHIPLIKTNLSLPSPMWCDQIEKHKSQTTSPPSDNSNNRRILCCPQNLTIAHPLVSTDSYRYSASIPAATYPIRQKRFSSSPASTIFDHHHQLLYQHLPHPSPLTLSSLPPIDPRSSIHNNGNTGTRRCATVNTVLPRWCDEVKRRVTKLQLIVDSSLS